MRPCHACLFDASPTSNDMRPLCLVCPGYSHFPAHPPGITTPSKPPNPMSTLIIERPDLTSKHVRDEISLVFDKYDTNQSGFLDKDQMASVPIRT